MDLKEALNLIKELKDEIEVSDKLLKERNRLLAEIPECQIHGNQCVPHAIEWVKKMKGE